jgi:hypothetical protein
MPRANLESGAYREEQGGDRYDQLKLDKDEVARLWIPDQKKAWREYTHTLRVPLFREDGSPLMGTKTIRGIERPVIETDFLGRPICKGDEETLKSQGLDVDKCLACAMIKRLVDDGITEAVDMKAQLRLAVPVIRYTTLKRTEPAPLQTPPGGSILVWAMSGWTYKQLDETRGQMAELLSTPEKDVLKDQVKLSMCDLAIHCDNKAWQKYDRIWALRAIWQHQSEGGRQVKAFIAALWGNEENRPTDEQLRAACGRDSTLEWLARDTEDVEWRWRKAHGASSPAGADPTGGGALALGTNSLSASIDGLSASLDSDDLFAPSALADDPLDGHPGGMAEFAAPDQQPALAAAAPLPPAPDDDLFGGPADVPPAPAAPAAPVQAPAAAPAVAAPPAAAQAPAAPAPAAPGTAKSFDDIFEGLEG